MGGVFLLLVLILMVLKIFQKVSSFRSKTSPPTIAKSTQRNVQIDFPLEEEIVYSSYFNNRDRLRSGDSDRRQLIQALLLDQRNTVV